MGALLTKFCGCPAPSPSPNPTFHQATNHQGESPKNAVFSANVTSVHMISSGSPCVTNKGSTPLERPKARPKLTSSFCTSAKTGLRRMENDRSAKTVSRTCSLQCHCNIVRVLEMEPSIQVRIRQDGRQTLVGCDFWYQSWTSHCSVQDREQRERNGERILATVQRIQPRLLVLAFPSRVWSPMLNYATSPRVRGRIDRERAAELTILDWVVSLCEVQETEGALFLVENPVGATSWNQPSM